MPPSNCPVCGRRMCDHTRFERGQTYAQMMGDTPGAIKHRKGKDCCCDECTDPGNRPPTPEERLQERTAELLVRQAIDRVLGGFAFCSGEAGCTLLTEEGSHIEVVMRHKDIAPIHKDGIAYAQADGEHLLLFTPRRRKIRVRVESLCIQETAHKTAKLDYMR